MTQRGIALDGVPVPEPEPQPIRLTRALPLVPSGPAPPPRPFDPVPWAQPMRLEPGVGAPTWVPHTGDETNPTWGGVVTGTTTNGTGCHQVCVDAGDQVVVKRSVYVDGVAVDLPIRPEHYHVNALGQVTVESGYRHVDVRTDVPGAVNSAHVGAPAVDVLAVPGAAATDAFHERMRQLWTDYGAKLDQLRLTGGVRA